MSLEDNASL